MEFREQCISSFFLHAIALLVMAAVAQYHPKVPDSLMVSFASEQAGGTIAKAQPGAQEVRETDQPAPQQALVQEVAETEEPEEPAEEMHEEEPVPTPQNDVAAKPPLPSDTALPGPVGNMSALAVYHHIVAMKTRAFVQNTGNTLHSALFREVKDNPSDIQEGTALITFQFDDQGRLGNVMGSFDQDKLKDLFLKVDWYAIPAPRDFNVKMQGLRLKVTISRSEPYVSISAF